MIQVIGPIKPPPGVERWMRGRTPGPAGRAPGLVLFLTAVIRLIIIVAGLYAFFNIIIAGYGFLGAGDDPKKMAAAWAKIWQSAIGLVIVAGSFILAAIFGYLIFGSPTAILTPQITGPM